MIKKLQKRKSVFITIGLLLSFFLSSTPFLSSIEGNRRTIEKSSENAPISAVSYSNTSLTIDADATSNSSHSGNWTWAIAQSWCSGDGTFSSPYLIRYITFNITGGENGLTILNSNNYYFTISDCNFTNADSSHSGLRLENTSNGTIVENEFHSNGYGIYLYTNCDNNSISLNYIYDSESMGIRLHSGCDENQILGNQISYTHYASAGCGIGIYIAYSCYNNTLSNNECTFSRFYGIQINNNCDFTIISNNTLKFNRNGLLVGDCYNTTIFNNTVSENGLSGVYQHGSGVIISGESLFTNISENIINHNEYSGVSLSRSSNTSVINNTINQNSIWNGNNAGIYFNEASFNEIRDNTVDENVYHSIWLYQDSHNNSISNNTISNSNYGLEVDRGSSNNNFTNNVISECNTRGIDLGSSVSNNYFENCNLTTVRTGVYLGTSHQNTFNRLQILGVQQNGLYLTHRSTSNVFSDISITGITEYGAYCSSDSTNNTFSDIRMDAGGFGIEGASNTTITEDCYLGGKEILVYDDLSSVNLDGMVDHDIGQIIIIRSNDGIIKNFEFPNPSIAITLIECDNFEIMNTTFENNFGYGMYSSYTSNLKVSNNTFQNIGENGFYALNCENVDFYNNNLVATEQGIGFSDCVDVCIEENFFINNTDVMYFYNCNQSVILSNELSHEDEGDDALCVEHSSDFIIQDNFITNYSMGLSIYESEGIVGNSNILHNSAIELDEESEDIAFGPSNFLNDLPVFYFSGHSKLRIGDTSTNNIFLSQCSQIVIENITVPHLQDSIRIYNSDQIYLRNITIESTDGSKMIIITESSNVSIHNGVFGDTCDVRMYISESENLTIQQCLFSNGSSYALELDAVYNFTISENWFYNMTEDAAITYYDSESGNIVDNVYGNVVDPWCVDDGGNLWVEVSNNLEVEEYNSSIFESLELEEFTFHLPTISNFVDISINAHSNVSISWDLLDTDPDSYYITCDGEIIVSPTKWESGTISFEIVADSLQDGLHVFQIWVNDTFNYIASAEILVKVDGTVPSIDSSSSFQITGEDILTLDWALNDTHPAYYVISRNGTLVSSPAAWDNGSVSFDIPALSLDDGIYSYQIWVNDTFGNTQVFETLIYVDGTAPIISSPSDVILDLESSSVLLNWTLNDVHPATYTISVNGTIWVSSTVWSNGLVFYNFTFADLDPGNYTIAITVQDTFGNEATNEVLLSISDEGDEGSNNAGLFIGLGIGGAGAIGVGVFVIIRKKRG